MVTSAEWVALTVSVIGVAGTLAGVVITQTLANRRDNQRLKREDRLRFHADKRQIYASFLGRLQTWRDQMFSQVNGEYGGQAYSEGGGFESFQSDVTTLIAELQLIAPSTVWTKAYVAWASGLATSLTLALPEEYPEEKRRDNIVGYSRHIDACIGAMRSDLGISETV